MNTYELEAFGVVYVFASYDHLNTAKRIKKHVDMVSRDNSFFHSLLMYEGIEYAIQKKQSKPLFTYFKISQHEVEKLGRFHTRDDRLSNDSNIITLKNDDVTLAFADEVILTWPELIALNKLIDNALAKENKNLT